MGHLAPQPTRGSGKRRKLPGRLRGRAPVENKFGTFLILQASEKIILSCFSLICHVISLKMFLTFVKFGEQSQILPLLFIFSFIVFYCTGHV